MDSEGRRRGIDGDDSLLASVAGVPLTRMARVAVCVIWARFRTARILLTDAMMHISPQPARCETAIIRISGFRAGRPGVQHLHDLADG